MIIFILGIIIALGALVSVFILEGPRKLFSLLALIVAGVMLTVSFIGIVPTGYTGILRTMGKVENYTLSAGMNIIKPWQDVVLMDNREQKIAFAQSGFSSDIQEVGLSGSVVYSIDRNTAMDLYQNVGTNYADIVIVPKIAECLKATVSKYTAEGLIGTRAQLSNEVLTMLQDSLKTYGLNIISVSIENIDFTDAFEQAVEAKQVATQTKQRAQTEQDQKTMEAQQAAERQRIQAQADADVARIQAEAAQYAGEREAEMNRKLSESLTPELVQYYYAQKWDGKLPTTMFGGDISSIMTMLPATPAN